VTDLLRRRKDHHVDIVLGEHVAGHDPALAFGRYTLELDALPEVDLDAVDLSCTVLGRRLRAPILVGAMTGGTERTGAINRTLAQAAARVGVGMALGSQRPMLVDPSVRDSFAVRGAAPDLPLLVGNLGAVQLRKGVGVEALRRLVHDVGADAINLHLNALQEAIQPEGDTTFAGLRDRITEAALGLDVPVLVKEVGAGLSERAARKLVDLPIAGLEVAGTGGTSWAAVEAYRAAPDDARRAIGLRLAGFGVPTPVSLRIVRRLVDERAPGKIVVASGGLRTGMDVAVSLALGATVVATAKPLLEAAVEGVDATVRALEGLIAELRILAFCCGAANLAELRRVRVIDTLGAWPGDPGVGRPG
jgi:isopentenyl-diphosphate delta-isomerase